MQYLCRINSLILSFRSENINYINIYYLLKEDIIEVIQESDATVCRQNLMTFINMNRGHYWRWMTATDKTSKFFSEYSAAILSTFWQLRPSFNLHQIYYENNNIHYIIGIFSILFFFYLYHITIINIYNK